MAENRVLTDKEHKQLMDALNVNTKALKHFYWKGYETYLINIPGSQKEDWIVNEIRSRLWNNVLSKDEIEHIQEIFPNEIKAARGEITSYTQNW